MYFCCWQLVGVEMQRILVVLIMLAGTSFSSSVVAAEPMSAERMTVSGPARDVAYRHEVLQGGARIRISCAWIRARDRRG